jgi:hypothetical protein
MTGFDSKRQMAQAKLDDDDMLTIVYAQGFADGKRSAQPEQEPTCPKCKAAVLYECVACSSNNYPPAAQPEQEPVAHSVIAGALFDFMGWLTTRKERLVLSSVDDASPAVVAITEFAKMRGLSLNDARVQDWQDYTTPPAAQRPWVGLTEEAVEAIGNEVANETLIGPVPSFRQRFAHALERALKEKNNV